MDNALTRTERQLDELRERTSSCLLAYSGGKDSLVIADLICRRFDHVEAFFMELVPDLACVEAALDFGSKRWGFKIHRVPHWTVWRYRKYGVFCKPQTELPEISLDQLYDHIRSTTGIEHVATGAKDSDSMWRRRQLGTWGKKSHMVYPVQKWNKLQILGYLKSRGIPLPDSSNKQATGVDLTAPSLYWLHDNHPADYQKLLRDFPFAHAEIARRKFFGLMHEGLFDGETRPTKE